MWKDGIVAVVVLAYILVMAVTYPMSGFLVVVCGLIGVLYISRPDIRLGWMLCFVLLAGYELSVIDGWTTEEDMDWREFPVQESGPLTY